MGVASSFSDDRRLRCVMILAKGAGPSKAITTDLRGRSTWTRQTRGKGDETVSRWWKVGKAWETWADWGGRGHLESPGNVPQQAADGMVLVGGFASGHVC